MLSDSIMAERENLGATGRRGRRYLPKKGGRELSKRPQAGESCARLLLFFHGSEKNFDYLWTSRVSMQGGTQTSKERALMKC